MRFIASMRVDMLSRNWPRTAEVTVTSAVRGVFRDSMLTRMEAMNLIGAAHR